MNLLSLPTYAVTQAESDVLAAKREAQLQWMREKGMSYLGDPLELTELRAKRRPATRKLRVVGTSEAGEREPREAASGQA